MTNDLVAMAMVDLGEDNPQVVAFKAFYEDPNFVSEAEIENGSSMVCDRCGALVPWGTTEKHLLWHQNLSFSMWLLQGWVTAHAAAHMEQKE